MTSATSGRKPPRARGSTTQVGANLTGIRVLVFSLGLWRSVSPDLLGRLGAGGLILLGLAQFLEGFLRLDCQGIDAGCANTSWHSDGHRIVSGCRGGNARSHTAPACLCVSATAALARHLTSDPRNDPRRACGDHRVLRFRERRSHACGGSRLVPLARLRRVSAAPESGYRRCQDRGLVCGAREL
jgi:hypothetical protein